MRKQTPEGPPCHFCKRRWATTAPRRIDQFMSVILHICDSARFDFIDGELVVYTRLQQGKWGKLTKLPAEKEAEQ